MKIKNIISFAFEGPDKVGKETQSKLLHDALMDLKVRVHRIEVPSKHHVCYDKIYDMLKRRDDGSAPAHDHPEILQTFIIANRFHVQDDVMRMAQAHVESAIVIFDRWDVSSWAYGNALNIPEKKIETINEGLMTADLTFILTGKGFARPEEGDDAFEDDNSFQNKVRKEYQRWIENHPESIGIHADRPKEIVHDEIFTIVKRYLMQEKIL